MNTDIKLLASNMCTCQSKISEEQLCKNKSVVKSDTNSSKKSNPHSSKTKKNLFKTSNCPKGINESEVKIHKTDANISISNGKTDNKPNVSYFNKHGKKEDILFKISSLKSRLNYFETKFQDLDQQRRSIQDTINCFYCEKTGNCCCPVENTDSKCPHRKKEAAVTDDSKQKYISRASSCCIINDSTKIKTRRENCLLVYSDNDLSKNRIKKEHPAVIQVKETDEEHCTTSSTSTGVHENDRFSKNATDVYKTLVELKSVAEKLHSELAHVVNTAAINNNNNSSLAINAVHANTHTVSSNMSNTMENILSTIPSTFRKWQYFELVQGVDQLELKIDKLTWFMEKHFYNEDKSNSNTLDTSCSKQYLHNTKENVLTEQLPDTKLFPLPPENWFKQTPRLRSVLIINEPIYPKVNQ